MEGLATYPGDHQSPKALARTAATLYVLTMLCGGIAQGVIAGRLIVPHADATTANILAHEALFRAGLATYLVEMALQVATTVLFYELLKPVSGRVARVGLAFGLIGCTIKTMARLFYVAPLLLLHATDALATLSPAQRDAGTQLFLRLNHQGETIAMVFFGVYAVVQGYLIARSGFLPRLLGFISIVGGLGWITYLYEPFAARIEGGIVGVAVIGSLGLAGWLIIAGVNEERWVSAQRRSSSI